MTQDEEIKKQIKDVYKKTFPSTILTLMNYIEKLEVELAEARVESARILGSKKYYDLAEARALTMPVVMWRFCAYKTEKDYESGEHYFVKDFLSHTQMKTFSAKHSAKEKPHHVDYCSMYWKIEINNQFDNGV